MWRAPYYMHSVPRKEEVPKEDNLELDLNTKEGQEFVLEAEKTILDIKSGKLEGTYLEF